MYNYMCRPGFRISYTVLYIHAIWLINILIVHVHVYYACSSLLSRFRPDFTLSRVSNTLRVHTIGTELLFPLVATLPQHLLPHCYVTQPRPDWEKTLAWFSVYFWTLTLVVVVGVALARTNCGMKPKLTHDTDKNLPLVQSTGGKMFDFKDLAKSFQNTITRKLSDLKTKRLVDLSCV